MAPTVKSESTPSHNMAGFHGIYNFRDQFWVGEGARIHGTLPHMTLNISQDLAHDMAAIPDSRAVSTDILHLPARVVVAAGDV